MTDSVKHVVNIVPRIKTPIGVVAFSLACSTVALSIGAAVAVKYDPCAFMWAVHGFLAVYGIFGLIIVLCPEALMTVDERIKARQAGIELRSHRWLVVLAATLLMFAYMVYWHGFTAKLVNHFTTPKPDAEQQHGSKPPE